MIKDFVSRLCLLPLFFLPLWSAGQTQYRQIVLESHTLDIAEWGKLDGLPHWHIGGFFQDSRGIIWLQSLNHLVRFDGQHFKVVQTQENPYPFLGVHNPFRQVDIREDLHHNIWRYFRASSQITVYNPTEDRHYTLEEYLGTATFPHIPAFSRMISMDDILYFINNQHGEIFRYDGQLKRCFTDKQRAPEPLPRMWGNEIHYFPAPDNRYWVIPQSGNTTLCDEQGEVIKTYPAQNPYTSFLSSGNRLYYYKRHPTDFSATAVYETSQAALPLQDWPTSRYECIGTFLANYADHNNEYQIISDQWYRPKLIVGEEKPLDLFEMIKASLEKEYGLTGQVLYQTYDVLVLPYQTADGSIWINGGRGLIQINILPSKFQSFFGSHAFRSLAWTGQDNGLLATSIFKGVEVLNRFQIDTKVVTPFPVLKTARPVYTVTVLNNQVWQGYADGHLACYDQNGGFRRSYLPPDSGKIYHPRALHILPGGKLAYGSDLGIVELDTISGKSRYILEGVGANDLFEDSGGQWWAGTARGMYHLGSNTFYLDSLPSGQPLDVTHIYEAPDHYFWLATRQGLVRWKPWAKGYAHYTTEHGLSHNMLHAVYPGGDDWLWLSSNAGIMAFNRLTHAVHAFFEEDGLANDEQNFLAHGRGPDGWLYFGGVNGITRFAPESIPSFDNRELASSIFVEDISYFASGSDHLLQRGILSEFDGPFYLPLNAGQLRISVVHPQFRLKKGPVIEWRINTLSPQWTLVENGNGIQVNGLPAGSFQLQIRIRDLATNRSAMVMTIPFYKARFFYQYRWFWLFLMTLSGFSIWLVIQLRTRTIKARNLILKLAVKKKTQELERSNLDILRQKEQLERIDTSKNQLFNNISHEFRTPLTLIRGYADQLLAYASTDTGVQKPAAIIKQQSETLSEMIEEILDLSKLQHGTIQVHKELVEWTAWLQREFCFFQGMAQRKQLDYQLRIDTAEKVYLLLDVQKMERILNNLIGNAIKFTPSTGRILVACSIREAEVELVVADTGPGITPEEQTYIFDRHFQGNASQQTSQPGYGIGLALCREYIQLMNGRLWVESQPGKGASFFVAFPKEPAPAPQSPPPHPTDANDASPRTFASLVKANAQRRLLIVEDNEQMLAFLVEILTEEFIIHTAAHGEEALAVLESEPDIDLIISDVMMPVMDGLTLLQKTRSHPVFGFIPFLILTALTAEEDKLQALRLGVDAFIPKPFDTVALKTQIRNLIRNQELRKTYLKQATLGADPGEAAQAPALAPLPQEEQHEESYDEQWMHQLQDTVQRHIGQVGFKVVDLASEMHLSERTLRNYLRAYTGLSPSEFLQKARLDRAHQLAKQKKYRTVAELAYAVGFQDAKHFSKLFTKEFGKSPTDYLR